MCVVCLYPGLVFSPAIDVITFHHRHSQPLTQTFTPYIPIDTMSSIPHKEIHAAATNPSERGFPRMANQLPTTRMHGPAPNNPATKTPAEMNKDWEGKTLDGRGAGTSGGRGREIHAKEGGGGAVGAGGRWDIGIDKHLNKKNAKNEQLNKVHKKLLPLKVINRRRGRDV